MISIRCKEEFERQIIQSKRPGLITFLASWCKPSQRQLGVLDSIESKYSNKVFIGTIDVDEKECVELCESFGISTLPTSLIFFRGALIETLLGFQQQIYLCEYLEAVLEQEKASNN